MAQTKILPGERFVAPSAGWFLTDSQLLDIDRDLRSIDGLRTAVAVRDSLIDLQRQRERLLRDLMDSQSQLIDDLSDYKTPGLLGQIFDTGTLTAIAVIGAAYIYNDAR